jgi:putative aminopeptidase FrvX
MNQALLGSILSQPSAPFRESHVIAVITHELKARKVPHFQDPAGNLVLGVASRAEYLRLVSTKSSEPVRLYIAHMDHPGFHGVRWRTPRELEVKWHGGSPTACLDGAAVWVADRTGWVAEGHLSEVKLIESGRAIDSAVVLLPEFDRRDDADAPEAPSLFGGFRFRSTWWQDGDLIYTKAADDLVGAFAITSLAIDLFSKRKKGKAPPFVGLLTRAEEVGFIGAIAHFELGWLKKARRPVMAVSLETSRQLPGAEVGKGPVVRLGDRYTVFSPGPLRVFTELAAKALPGRHQRRVMDGGTCEGTAALVYGLPVIAISVPLGNYHNQSFEGGPDSRGENGPAPEFVSLSDVEGMAELCRQALRPKLPWVQESFKARRGEFKRDLRKYASLMKSGR